MKTKISEIASLLTCVMLAIGMAACHAPIHEDEEFAVYRYSVNLHYLDGGSKKRTFITRWEPYISAGYKSGFPRFYWTPVGEREYMENGVCRFEVISKRDITEEYYGKKIISSRRYWDPASSVGGTLHKLSEKEAGHE